jgi:hypothetical protein
MTVSIENNKLKTDLYRKETYKVQYQLPISCHPSCTFKSVPYSTALRLVRICSDQSDLKKRLTELENMLISRKYNKNIIRHTIAKALKLGRMEVLKKLKKQKQTE